MMTVYQFVERRYDRDFKWRKAWNDLANNIELGRKKYPLQTQNEYFQHRAELANLRIAELMQAWDLHKPERR